MAKHQTFKKLVKNEGDKLDFVGMVAYTLYKEQKINWIDSFNTKQGREPTLEEVEQGFNVDTDSDMKVGHYRSIAEEYLDEFLNASIGEQLKQYEKIVEHSEIIKAVKTGFWDNVKAGVVAGLIGAGIISLISYFGWIAQVKNDPAYQQYLIEQSKKRLTP